MYWLEIYSPHVGTARVEGLSKAQLDAIAPFLGGAGLASSFGIYHPDGSKELLGGCLAASLEEDGVHYLHIETPDTTH
ncbi:TPA: hypothetical protein ACG4NT_000152 [Stenotrophomonas maltophilia]|nr:hypothetical protein B9Y63_04580 [Stenotrophomonas maltophilia]